MHKKLATTIAFVLVAVLFSSCAVMIPTHELGGPETMGSGGIRPQVNYVSAPVLGPNDPRVTNNANPDTAVSMGARLAVGVFSKLDIVGDVMMGSTLGGSTGIGLKFQWWGDPYFDAKGGQFTTSSLARMWESKTSAYGLPGDNLYQNADITGTGYDLVQNVGYWLNDVFQIYVAYRVVKGDIFTNFRTVSGGPITLKETRPFEATGGVLGLVMAFKGKKFGVDLIIEHSRMDMPAPFAENRITYDHTNFSIGFPFMIGSGK